MNEADANVSWNPWDSDRIPSFGSIRSLVQTVLACLKSAGVQLLSDNLIEDEIFESCFCSLVNDRIPHTRTEQCSLDDG